MGCLQQMKVGGGEGGDPRDQVSAMYAQRIQQSCRCFDLDQREEVGTWREESPPMPAALASALEAALATFETKATKMAGEHQREIDHIHSALGNADDEDHEPPPPLEEAGSDGRSPSGRRAPRRRESSGRTPYGSASRPPPPPSWRAWCVARPTAIPPATRIPAAAADRARQARRSRKRCGATGPPSRWTPT